MLGALKVLIFIYHKLTAWYSHTTELENVPFTPFPCPLRCRALLLPSLGRHWVAFWLWLTLWSFPRTFVCGSMPFRLCVFFPHALECIVLYSVSLLCTSPVDPWAWISLPLILTWVCRLCSEYLPLYFQYEFRGKGGYYFRGLPFPESSHLDYSRKPLPWLRSLLWPNIWRKHLEGDWFTGAYTWG